MDILKRIGCIFVFAVAFLSSPAIAQVNGLSELQISDADLAVLMCEKELTVNPAPMDTVSIEQGEALRELLLDSQFALLNDGLRSLDVSANMTSFGNTVLESAFSFLATGSNTITPAIDAWAAATPDEFYPHLAVGLHYFNLGFKARGNGFYRSIDSERRAGFNMLMSVAVSALEKALSIDPQSEVSLAMLFSASKVVNDTARVKVLRELFDDRYAGNLQINQTLLTFLVPKWGGSHREMIDFTLQRIQYQQSDIEDYVLRGNFWLLLGREKLHNRADYLYRTTYCARSSMLLRERASAFSWYRFHEFAYKDLKQALVLYPVSYKTHRELARIQLFNRDFDASRHYFAQAERIQPSRNGHQTWNMFASNMFKRAGDSHLSYRKYEEALDAYKVAASLDPENIDAAHSVFKSMIEFGYLEEADSYVQRVLDIDPLHYEANAHVAGKLARQDRWDEAFQIWDRLIKDSKDPSLPLSARGYMYIWLEEFGKARLDLEKACFLGVRAACDNLITYRKDLYGHTTENSVVGSEDSE